MNRIAMLRKERKLSQKELGAIVGVAQNTICNWENGKRDPDYDSLKKMAIFFHCSIDDILGLTNIKKEPVPENGDGLDETDQRLMEYVKAMTPDQKKLLLAQMKVLSEQEE